MIKAKVHDTAKIAWYDRVSNPEFYRFKILHCEFNPHWLWFRLATRSIIKSVITICQLLH